MEKKTRVDQILTSLDNAQRAEASPYLYSKIRNQLEAPRQLPSGNLAWRVAFVLLLVGLLNIYTLAALPSNETTDSAQAAAIAEDYSLSLPADY